MTKDRQHRDACPLCGSSERQPLRRVLRGGAHYDLVTCRGCRFVYVVDPPGETADEADVETLVWRQARRHFQIRQLLLRLVRPGARVVEIGCGRGDLGRTLKGDRFEYIGFDLSVGYCQFGQRHGLDVRCEAFAGQVTGDAIILDNVLEHVREPRSLLATAVSSLRPGGLIVVIVPNRHDIRQLLPGWRRQRHWIPPDHINYFTAGNVVSLLAGHGLKPRAFGFAPLGLRDYKYAPRAALETIGFSPFGHNFYAVKAA